VELNTIEAAARAAAVSPATSDPGLVLSIKRRGRASVMVSGLSQQKWSVFGSPTWKNESKKNQ
jgi:hypothetical protein